MKLKPYLHKVQYYETDQMSIVHHSNYIRWFEEARVDWFDQMGLPFSQIEAMGIQIPVVSCSARYLRSALFGDTVEIHLWIEKYNGVRLIVGYQVLRHGTQEVLATGQSEHCFTTRNGAVMNLRRKYPQVDDIFQKCDSWSDTH
jgi:acyl-CoA thioester hydrolase